MNKSQAIRIKCLKCSGDRPKEVTLCHIVDCSLWPFRLGSSVKSQRFKARMAAAKKNYPREYQEMYELLSEYVKNRPNYFENVKIDELFE